MNLDELKQSFTEDEKQSIEEVITIIIVVVGLINIFGGLAILLVCIG